MASGSNQHLLKVSLLPYLTATSLQPPVGKQRVYEKWKKGGKCHLQSVTPLVSVCAPNPELSYQSNTTTFVCKVPEIASNLFFKKRHLGKGFFFLFSQCFFFRSRVINALSRIDQKRRSSKKSHGCTMEKCLFWTHRSTE